MAGNELDTHADTSCADANWALLEYTGEICEVSPFLTTYDPIQEIPVAQCCTVWTPIRQALIICWLVIRCYGLVRCYQIHF